MAQALDNSGTWGDRYARLAEAFLAQVPVGVAFTGETMRFDALGRGLGEPHHVNAWGAAGGAIVRRWRKLGYIAEAGVSEAHSVRAHGRKVQRYVRMR